MPSCPADTLPAGAVQVLAEGFLVNGLPGTEGLVFSPDGRLFVGGSGWQGGGYVAEVWPDGTWATLADVPLRSTTAAAPAPRRPAPAAR